jgi:hypothetical protein
VPGGSEGGPESGGEGAQVAHRRRHRVPRHKSVVARQNTHVHPGVSAKAGEAVKRKKYGAVQGFVVEAGGRLGPAAKKFIDEVVAECEMSEAARKAAASKILRAIGI